MISACSGKNIMVAKTKQTILMFDQKQSMVNFFNANGNRSFFSSRRVRPPDLTLQAIILAGVKRINSMISKFGGC